MNIYTLYNNSNKTKEKSWLFFLIYILFSVCFKMRMMIGCIRKKYTGERDFGIKTIIVDTWGWG
jgi:hypothetical protein